MEGVKRLPSHFAHVFRLVVSCFSFLCFHQFDKNVQFQKYNVILMFQVGEITTDLGKHQHMHDRDDLHAEQVRLISVEFFARRQRKLLAKTMKTREP